MRAEERHRDGALGEYVLHGETFLCHPLGDSAPSLRPVTTEPELKTKMLTFYFSAFLLDASVSLHFSELLGVFLRKQ